jgi:hypothetical protein
MTLTPRTTTKQNLVEIGRSIEIANCKLQIARLVVKLQHNVNRLSKLVVILKLQIVNSKLQIARLVV